MTSLLRVAVVGCGAICGNHIKSIRAAGQTLCALCDINVEQAKQKALKYGVENVNFYEDYQTMLECEAIDVVHICTPHHLHEPMIVAALERDVHVLCEKPFCISLEQLHRLQNAAAKSRAQLGVCHQNRYVPNMMRLKELASDGVRAGFGSVVWHREQEYYDSAEWRGTWAKEGGGVMINQALHTLDLMQWICGFPKNVIAHTHNDLLQDAIEVEDTATACFECENGVRFNFFATNSGACDLPVQIQVKLNNGDLVDAQNDQFCLNHTPISSSAESEAVGKQVWGNGHLALISDFYDCIQTNQKFSIDAEEAGKVIRMILAMYASNGEKIEIPI